MTTAAIVKTQEAPESPMEAQAQGEDSNLQAPQSPTDSLLFPDAARSPVAFECQSVPVLSPPVQTLQGMPNPPEDIVSAPPSVVDIPAVPVAEQLRLGVQAVLDIDTYILFENWSVSAFAQLRKAVLHAAHLPAVEMLDIIEGEAAHGAAVLTFLVDIVKGSPIRSSQVCEVLDILLQCPGWQSAFCKAPALIDRVAQEDVLPEVQACFKKTSPKNGEMSHRICGRDLAQKFKNLRRWMLGCGQKSGEGVSSPRQRTHAISTARGGA